MKKFTITFLLVFNAVMVFSQTVVLEQDVNKDTIQDKSGPNRKKFGHFYVGYGLILGPAESDSVSTKLGSNEYRIGFRYKYRISNYYSLGFDISYNAKNYIIKQDAANIFPNNTPHKRAKLVSRNLGLDLFNRINYGKRGNYVGNFIDLGVYTDWTFAPVYVTYDKYDIANSVGASRTRQVHGGLTYLNAFNYGGIVRLGFNKFVLYGTYRISDIFKPDYIYSELPRMVIGLQFSFHK